MAPSSSNPDGLPITGLAEERQRLEGWVERQGEVMRRQNGVLVADRTGNTTAFALSNLEDRGELFLSPGTEVYEGMIAGENSRQDDIDVNVTKPKKLTMLTPI